MTSRDRPHPLRQSQTIDYSFLRAPSTTSSSASSGDSNFSYDVGRSSLLSSPSSVYSNAGHKRGQSEASKLPTLGTLGLGQTLKTISSDNIYSAARQSLKPLAQAPASGSPTRSGSGGHSRGESLGVIGSLSSSRGKGKYVHSSPPIQLPPGRTGQLRNFLFLQPESTSPRPSSPQQLSTRTGTVRHNSMFSPPPDTLPMASHNLDISPCRLSLTESGSNSPPPQYSSTKTLAVRAKSTPSQSPSPTLSLARDNPSRHERGQSVDLSKMSINNGKGSDSPPPLAHTTSMIRSVRPKSMLLTRSDSVLHFGSEPTQPLCAVTTLSHHPHTTTLARPDLEMLGRSSTNQLRTLSKLAQSDDAEDFAITSPAQEVVGLRGRRKLQRQGVKRPVTGWEYRNWMDKQRQFLQAYEYLCHIGEAKEWIEDVIHRPIPPIVELEEALRDGVTLAEVVEALNPDRRLRVFRHPRLQFRHSDNIAIFFRYLDEVELPDLFRFELIDLYEKKNIPKVIYCIHALSWLLFRKGIVDFRIGNLVGQLEFEHHELEAMQKGLEKLGVNMPSFGDMGADFGIEPEPEPEETEQEREQRELAEVEGAVVELQAQVRGALGRMRLGGMMNQLWDAEELVADLQARIRGDFTRQVVGYRLEMRRFAVGLQSAARGFMTRRRAGQEKHLRKAVEPLVVQLQSMARANRVRNAIDEERRQLERAAGPMRKIQAAARGFLVREWLYAQQEEVRVATAPTEGLQAAVRGMLLRRKLKGEWAELAGQEDATATFQAAARAALTRSRVAVQMEELNFFTPAWDVLQAVVRGALARDQLAAQRKALNQSLPAWTTLQAAARGKLARDRFSAEREALVIFAPTWEALQAACRGKLARDQAKTATAKLQEHEAAVEQVQACIRGASLRRDVSQTLDGLAANEEATIELQAMVRGMLTRCRIGEDLEALNEQSAAVEDLQSRSRGLICRRQQSDFLDELATHEADTTTFQALARAMMHRGEVVQLLERLDKQEEAVVELQAACKAFVVRAKFEEKKRFFDANMQRVVKIQSFVRAKLQGEAYKSLTTGRNPPVNAVKNFVHLLNDSDFDFNEEVEFERLRKTVVQQVRQNEMLEQYIDQLDIKIALLVKNKITLDEVVRHQSNYGGHTSSLLANSSMASASQFDLKALNKSSRKKLELYQQLFFTLQTQPHYLARLFRRVREQGTPEKECKRVELLMMGLFGYAQKRREEYYLLKLIGRSIREEVEGSAALQDYVRGNFFWSRLLANYTRSPRDRKYLRELLGPLIRDNIIEDPALDLESDPVQIYRSSINNEELRTGRPGIRPPDIPRELAIKDPETRELFIDHLRDLREICDQFLLALEDLLPRMPYGLRIVCRQMYEALCSHFKREPQTAVVQIVSNWLWKFYLQPALVAPENVGVIEKNLSPLQKRNLGEVAKVLSQIAVGRPFGGENIYLQPLNAFLAESVERLAHITRQLLNVPDAEATFDIDEYNDLYAKNKPTLYIKMSDIFAIHTLVASELPALCPNRDDLLREIMQDLGSAKNNESEMAASSSDIQLFLTPKLHETEDPEAEIKALFMETKRCILYIVRVQSGANLLEILVKPITPDDDHKWTALLREDFAHDGRERTRGAYSDANMADVTRMSYYELKRTALENVMRLERAGRISKRNFYQDILNAIALDIRTKSRRRVQRQRELEGVRATLGNLHEKARYLEQQRKSYDDYIEQAMATLQNKKGKKRFLLPFTKQYNHQRELERSGRVPKFGSYKYSARALADKGVLVSWQGAPEKDWGQINLTISCDEVGVFALEGSRGHIQIPGASAMVPIEGLLQAQFESHQFMEVFEGMARLNVNLLLHLLYKKFYRTV